MITSEQYNFLNHTIKRLISFLEDLFFQEACDDTHRRDSSQMYILWKGVQEERYSEETRGIGHQMNVIFRFMQENPKPIHFSGYSFPGRGQIQIPLLGMWKTIHPTNES